MNVTYINEDMYASTEREKNRIILSNFMTEAKSVVLLVQVELVD